MKYNQRGSATTIIMVIILFVIVAVGTSFYAINTLGNKKQEVVKGILIPVGNVKDGGVIVNISNSSYYVKTTVMVEIKESSYAKSEGKGISKVEAVIQDTTIQTLRIQKPEQFKAEKQEQLKEQIKQNINRALGGDVVLNVYFTGLVIQ